MSFLDYVKDKRFFFTFYLCMMVFISLVLLFGSNQDSGFSLMLYINISCFLLLLFYIAIGFFYRKKFYNEFKDLVESNHEEVLAILPDAQKLEQKLFMNLFQKILGNYQKQLQNHHQDKREQQEFIMSWIHEVKLPIAASRLLIENSEGKSVEYMADKFEDELNKIDDYVEQALFYSRIDSFSKDYFIGEVHVNKIIKNSIKKYAKLFINKGIRLNMTDEDQNVQSDSKWLGFVFDQIIVNSLKYTEANGEISIRFEEDSKEKRILIEDNGIGIKQEDLKRVFEKGFTGETGRNYSKSTGMGLYLAKRLANKLGHDLSIESEKDVFTRTTIHFPKVRSYLSFQND
jgi:signal transduction histidine kinase